MHCKSCRERQHDLYESPSEVTLEDRQSKQMPDQDQFQVRLNLQRCCVNWILQSPNNDELTRDMLRSQEKGTEVDKRTAELYSEQGNIDITEIVVIDETMQCEKCQEHHAKRKCFLQRWFK